MRYASIAIQSERQGCKALYTSELRVFIQGLHLGAGNSIVANLWLQKWESFLFFFLTHLSPQLYSHNMWHVIMVTSLDKIPWAKQTSILKSVFHIPHILIHYCAYRSHMGFMSPRMADLHCLQPCRPSRHVISHWSHFSRSGAHGWRIGTTLSCSTTVHSQFLQMILG